MPTTSKPSAGELYLQFQLGEDRYALAAREVVEVLPLRRLKQIPEAPQWVAGLLAHRGQMIPVLDLSHRVLGRPALTRSSTRLVLVHFAVQPGRPAAVLGLILEQASNTLRLPDEAFQASGLEAAQPAYLGPVQEHGTRLIQRIEVDGLLDAAMRALLFQATERG